MARFPINQTIETAEPTVVVDAGLPVGAHRFQLEVIDSAGNRSRPDVAVVEVQRLVIPTGPVVGPVVGPVIDPVGPVVGPVIGPVLPPTSPVIGPTRLPRGAPKRGKGRDKKE